MFRQTRTIQWLAGLGAGDLLALGCVIVALVLAAGLLSGAIPGCVRIERVDVRVLENVRTPEARQPGNMAATTQPILDASSSGASRENE